MENHKNELVTQNDLSINFAEIQGLSDAFYKSGMFENVRNAAQAVVKIVAGRELGLPAAYSMQNINLIRGRLCSSANTLALLVKRSGRYNYRVKEHTDTVCTITFYEREGDKWIEVGESKFTIDDAKRADLIKPDGGWVKYPRAMLFSRAISQGARVYCPDAIGGIYTAEEMTSIETATTIDEVPQLITSENQEHAEGKVAKEVPQLIIPEIDPPPTEISKDCLSVDWSKETRQNFLACMSDLVKQLQWDPVDAHNFLKERFKLNHSREIVIAQRNDIIKALVSSLNKEDGSWQPK